MKKLNLEQIKLLFNNAKYIQVGEQVVKGFTQKELKEKGINKGQLQKLVEQGFLLDAHIVYTEDRRKPSERLFFVKGTYQDFRKNQVNDVTY